MFRKAGYALAAAAVALVLMGAGCSSSATVNGTSGGNVNVGGSANNPY